MTTLDAIEQRVVAAIQDGLNLWLRPKDIAAMLFDLANQLENGVLEEEWYWNAETKTWCAK